MADENKGGIFGCGFLLLVIFLFYYTFRWCAGCGGTPKAEIPLPPEKTIRFPENKQKIISPSVRNETTIIVAENNQKIKSSSPKSETFDFTGLRGVLQGKWFKQGKNEFSSDHYLNFSEKSVELTTSSGHYTNSDFGKYQFNGDLLQITDQRGNNYKFGIEFTSDREIVFRPEGINPYQTAHFGTLLGYWQRISLPPGYIRSKPQAGPISLAKDQVQKIEQLISKRELTLKSSFEARNELAEKLRYLGINSSADIKNNIRAIRIAKDIQKVSAEIETEENKLAQLESDLFIAKSIVRNLEREQAGFSENEMKNLFQQLHDVQERTNSQPGIVTPIDIDEAVEKALKGSIKKSKPVKTN